MKNKKKILSIVTGLFFATSISSYAKLPIEYDYFTINGKKQKIAIADLVIDGKAINKSTAGVVPLTINSRTLVPVRALSERLGYHVTWIESAQKVTIDNAGKKIELVIGSTSAKSNGKTVSIPDGVAPLIIDSSTYVPIRFVVENLGLDINYDSKKNQISLNSTTVQISTIKTNNNDASLILGEEKKVESHTATDPSVPLDVERFVVNKPITPEKPVTPIVPVVSKSEEQKPKEEKEVQQTELNELTSQFSKEKEEVFKIVQKSGTMDANYFYLTNPKKLVIDIKNAKIESFETEQKDLGGLIFKSLNSLYHSDGNYTRYAIELGDSVDTNKIKLSLDKNVFTAEKMPKKEPIQQQGNALDYSFDRSTGYISILANKEIQLQNISTENTKLQLTIPKDAIKLNKGNLGISNRMINSAKVSQSGSEYLIDITLSDRVTYTIEPTGKKSYKISFVKNNRDVPIIHLDAGHGGKDSGAVNYEFNITEKALNLQIINKLRPKLENAGYKVVLTRSDDTFVPLNDIAAKSNNNDPDIFISVHHNSVDGSPSTNGIETFYYNSKQSKKLADTLRKYLIQSSGAFDRGSKNMGFVVIKKTTAPATLLELGFMSNRNEIQKNMSDSYQNLLTDAIVSGVNEYFGR